MDGCCSDNELCVCSVEKMPQRPKKRPSFYVPSCCKLQKDIGDKLLDAGFKHMKEYGTSVYDPLLDTCFKYKKDVRNKTLEAGFELVKEDGTTVNETSLDTCYKHEKDVGNKPMEAGFEYVKEDGTSVYSVYEELRSMVDSRRRQTKSGSKRSYSADSAVEGCVRKTAKKDSKYEKCLNLNNKYRNSLKKEDKMKVLTAKCVKGKRRQVNKQKKLSVSKDTDKNEQVKSKKPVNKTSPLISTSDCPETASEIPKHWTRSRSHSRRDLKNEREKSDRLEKEASDTVSPVCNGSEKNRSNTGKVCVEEKRVGIRTRSRSLNRNQTSDDITANEQTEAAVEVKKQRTRSSRKIDLQNETWRTDISLSKTCDLKMAVNQRSKQTETDNEKVDVEKVGVFETRKRPRNSNKTSKEITSSPEKEHSEIDHGVSRDSKRLRSDLECDVNSNTEQKDSGEDKVSEIKLSRPVRTRSNTRATDTRKTDLSQDSVADLKDRSKSSNRETSNEVTSPPVSDTTELADEPTKCVRSWSSSGKEPGNVNETKATSETNIAIPDKSNPEAQISEDLQRACYLNRLANVNLELFSSDLNSVLSSQADVGESSDPKDKHSGSDDGCAKHSVELREFRVPDLPMSDVADSDSDNESLPDIHYIFTPKKKAITATAESPDIVTDNVSEKPANDPGPLETLITMETAGSLDSTCSLNVTPDPAPSAIIKAKTSQKKQKRPKDELSEKGKARQQKIRKNNQKLVKFLTSPKVKKHLMKILLEKEPSKIRDRYQKATPRERRSMQQCGFGPLDDDDQEDYIETVLQTFNDWIRKTGKDPTNYVNYVFAVWVPEAFVYAFCCLKKYSKKKALEMFKKGYRRTKEERKVLMASMRKNR